MRMSRVQPKAVDCVRDATTNSHLSEWQAKHVTACSKSSYESDSYYPNHADVREAPTNYRRNPWEQVKAYHYSDEYHDISSQPWQCQPNSSSGKSLVKQDPQNRSYTRPRKARKRHKTHPKPSPSSPPVAGALCAQIKETQQLPDHPTSPPTMESSHEHKKRPNQGSPPTPNKAECAQPTETHSPTIHPPYPLTMESFYRWYAEQGCSTPNPDYSWTPNVCKAREKAETTISSESDSDSHYSDRFDSAKAPYSTPPNTHMGTPTTSVHSIEACYKTPVGHFFHVEHEALRKVEAQHPRHVNPRRRVGKKKPLDPRPR
jgi:hypothetical protein